MCMVAGSLKKKKKKQQQKTKKKKKRENKQTNKQTKRKPLVSVSCSNLVWDLTDFAKQTFNMKYDFDESTYQISNA